MAHHKPRQVHSLANFQGKPPASAADRGRTLELVVKGDTGDIVKAVVSSLLALSIPECRVAVIGQGVGDINKNDLLTAATGSHLIIGFNVNVLPHVAEECRHQTIDVRLYGVIYTLIEDMRRLIGSIVPPLSEEVITGNARVIALFKSSRKGVIIGCQVLDGRIRQGDNFRLISAMGPIYSGTIGSLHIEQDSVSQALAGHNVGIKIPDFKRVSIGDMVECLAISKAKPGKRWEATGTVTVVANPS